MNAPQVSSRLHRTSAVEGKDLEPSIQGSILQVLTALYSQMRRPTFQDPPTPLLWPLWEVFLL